jgi:hypothetical protein
MQKHDPHFIKAPKRACGKAGFSLPVYGSGAQPLYTALNLSEMFVRAVLDRKTLSYDLLQRNQSPSKDLQFGLEKMKAESCGRRE